MNRFARFLFLSSSALAASVALALPGDRDLPVNVEADRNRGSLTANEIVYTGNVRITQGALTIEGHEVTVYRNDNDEIRRMEAIGGDSPAWVTDQFEEDEPVTRLDGETVIYDSEAGFISAQGSARLQQGRNLVTAHYIRFELDTEDFESDRTAPDGSEGERVNMCLTREEQTDSNEESANGETSQRPASC